MTALYFDTNIGCYSSDPQEWTIEDEGKQNFIDRIAALLRF